VKCLSRAAAGKSFHHSPLGLDGLAQLRILGDESAKAQIDIQKSVGNSNQLVEQFAAFLGSGYSVGKNLEVIHAVFLAEQLDPLYSWLSSLIRA